MAFGTARLECGRGDWNSWCSSEMRRYQEEYRWRRQVSGLTLTLMHESVGSNRIRYPGSPRPKRCRLVVGGLTLSVTKLTREVDRLGSTAARLKLKGIDGDPHKRWIMWINSMQREKPYLPLTCPRGWRDPAVPERGSEHRCCMAVVSSCREMLG